MREQVSCHTHTPVSPAAPGTGWKGRHEVAAQVTGAVSRSITLRLRRNIPFLTASVGAFMLVDAQVVGDSPD